MIGSLTDLVQALALIALGYGLWLQIKINQRILDRVRALETLLGLNQ